MSTLAEENYLKSIYHLLKKTDSACTNDIAAQLNTKAASVTDMLKKLAEKKLINYARYQGVSLTPAGEHIALDIVRKHRLWEHFLVEKLNFRWDEVHDMAEELEHVSSTALIDRLDAFMDHPQFDPHGDPIPDTHGNIKQLHPIQALQLDKGRSGTIAAVADHSPAFLQYLEKTQLTIGQTIRVTDVSDYDVSIELEALKKELNISREVAKNLLIAI